MKICKVNKRWKSFYQNGFELVLRFDTWSNESSRVEKWLKSTYNTHGYDDKGPFQTRYGRSNRWNTPRPYFIAIRESAIISALLLSVQLDEGNK